MNDNELSGGTELREGRREMKSGQIKKTPYGDVKFLITVDMPGRISEDHFKTLMVEYGEILVEAFGK